MAAFASVLSAALFLAALLSWGLNVPARYRRDLEAPSAPPFAAREYGAVLLLCLASLVLHAGLVSAVRLAAGKNTAFADTFRVFTGLDSRHYFDIARGGYGAMAENGEYLNLVFFPGYPLLTALFMLVFPEDLSGYLAAWIPFLLAGMALYRLFRLDRGRPAALRMLLWLCVVPGAVFYSYPMSESLYLAAAAAALYLARTRRWFAAGVCGFVAAFTRSLGILLLLPLGIELLESCGPFGKGFLKAHWKELLKGASCLLLIPLAFAVYLCLNKLVAGDPLIFLRYQESNWHQSAGWFFRTAGTQAEYALRTWTETPYKFWGLWLPNLLAGFGSLALMLLRGRRLRLSEGAWFFVYFAVAYGATWLLSGPRYMAVFFPMAALIEEAPGPKWLRGVLLGGASLFYLFCFAMRWSVW